MDDSAPAGSAPDPDDARLLRSVRRLADRLSALPPERGDDPDEDTAEVPARDPSWDTSVPPEDDLPERP